MRAALALALMAAACGRPWIPVATEVDAQRAAVSAAELNHGRTLLLGHCGNCHQPPSPADRRAAEWPQEVYEMSERSGLEPLEAEAVVRYLAAFASDRPR